MCVCLGVCVSEYGDVCVFGCVVVGLEAKIERVEKAEGKFSFTNVEFKVPERYFFFSIISL